MKHAALMRGLALGVLSAVAAGPAQAQGAAPSEQSQACAAEGAGGVAQLHRDWIFGWDKKPGDPPFDFRAKFGRFYDWSGRDVHLYDDFEPQQRVARSPDAYGGFWAAPFTALARADHGVIDGPDVLSGAGDIAASTMAFVARLEAADGRITGIKARSSIVWRCHAQGWRIVREHNSTRQISPTETDALLHNSR